jgi:hypothetical protein
MGPVMRGIALNRVPFFLIVLLFVLVSFQSSADSDVGSGQAGVTSVTSMVHSAGEVEILFNQFNKTMENYDNQKTKCGRLIDPKEKARCNSIAKRLLKDAKDILAKLNKQARGIESEIAVKRKKVNKRLAKKLDRILKAVVEMRRAANSRMKASSVSG